MFTLGYKVRELRTLHNLSKRQLGELCGVTEWCIRDVEQRGSGVRIALLAKLRRVFDISYDELLGDIETMDREQLDAAIAMVNSAIARGSKEARRDLTALIEHLHSMECLEQREAPAPRQRTRSRQLQLPPEPDAQRASGRRRS
jgi:transcriptional regulator with XRE-family HTH domain